MRIGDQIVFMSETSGPIDGAAASDSTDVPDRATANDTSDPGLVSDVRHATGEATGPGGPGGAPLLDNLPDLAGATQMNEGVPTAPTKWEDFIVVLSDALLAELRNRGLEVARVDGQAMNLSESTGIGAGGASRTDHGKEDEYWQQFIKGVAAFTAAVRAFANQEHEIKINVQDSGTSCIGQITRYGS